MFSSCCSLWKDKGEGSVFSGKKIIGVLAGKEVPFVSEKNNVSRYLKQYGLLKWVDDDEHDSQTQSTLNASCDSPSAAPKNPRPPRKGTTLSALPRRAVPGFTDKRMLRSTMMIHPRLIPNFAGFRVSL